MSGSTHNKIQRNHRSIGIVTAAIGLAAAASMVAPQAFGTAAEAPAQAEARSLDTAATTDAETPESEVTYERGVALAGTGDLNGRQVFVEIYGNSLYGSQATLVIEQPGGPDLSASVELATEELLGGNVDLDVAMSRNTRGGPVATRSSARITGSWQRSGTPTNIDETYADAGYLIHTTGTNTALAAEVTVYVDGKQATLQMFDAFAFDLTVTRTPL